MATQFEIDCALMAGRVYQSSRNSSGSRGQVLH